MPGPRSVRQAEPSAQSPRDDVIPQWSRTVSLNLLAQAGVQRSYRKGTILINQGDDGGSLFIIKKGAVQAYVEGPSGRVLTISTYREGEYVGEMALDGGRRSASVITIESTDCSLVSIQALKAHIRVDPDFAIDLITRLIQRARIATESAKGLALLDVYGRVRNLLQQAARPQDDGSRLIDTRMTHQAIADQVGASREMISKILKELSVGGYIQVERHQMKILKPLPAGW